MPENDDDLTLPTVPARRTVLRGALVLGAAGVLAGCGGSSSDNNAAQTPTDTGSTPPPAETTPTPTAKAKKSAKPKASATPTTEASASSKPKATTKAEPKPKGTLIGPVSDVGVGKGKIYEDTKVVITQPKAGEYHMFSAVCTHQSCILADCDGGKINCGCHASSFDFTTGAPDGGPATVPLPKYKVEVSGGKFYKV